MRTARSSSIACSCTFWLRFQPCEVGGRGATMNLSRLPSRRTILGLAVAAALTRVVPVRAAQTTAGCDIGFTYGLLTIGGADCQLLSPPGMDGTNISLPTHLVDGRSSSTTAVDGTITPLQATSPVTGTSTTSTSTTSLQAERQARLQKRRTKKRTKRGRATAQRKKQATRKKDRKITCEDFTTQKAAIEWLAQYPEDTESLDPNGDRLPCVELAKVSCSQFTDAEDARAWLKFYDYPVVNDPFGLYDETRQKICPAKG
jgi:hypothetical protein